MIKLMAAAICAAALFTSEAIADEVGAGADLVVSGIAVPEEPADNLVYGFDKVAVEQALRCRASGKCEALSDEDRAKAALALLYLRVIENCNRHPCAINLASKR